MLEVSQPRLPYAVLSRRFGGAKMVKRFPRAGWPGGYLRIGLEGGLGAGDPITVLSRPEHGVTVQLVARAS